MNLVKEDQRELTADKQLRHDVCAELEWEPSIDAGGISVSVAGAVVTLSGCVPTYAQKLAASEAAMRVRGVRAVAQELEVRPPRGTSTSDSEIAARALELINWNVDIPAGWVKLIVEKGYVTLTGQVDWQFQRQAAERCVHQLDGVKGIVNHIALRLRPQIDDVTERIQAALKRSAEIEAHAIRVSVFNDHVMLEGRVRTPHERKLLEHAVWGAPGVRSLDNRVEVGEPVVPPDHASP
jgi:osmotically-inducible protein OsmY